MQPRDQPLQRDGDIDLDGQLIVGRWWFQCTGLGLDHVKGFTDDRIIGVTRLCQFRAPGVAAKATEPRAMAAQSPIRKGRNGARIPGAEFMAKI